MNILQHRLTTPQQNIYNETKFYSDTALGNIGGTLEFSMEGLTSEIIEKAITLLIDAAEGLRLRITEAGGEVCQYVCNHEYESIPVIDATELTQEQIDEHVSALMKTPITYDGRLYRFEILKKADSWLIVAVMHHIVSDAWSMTIIDDAILHACEALVKGEEPVLNIAPYTDFVAKEQEYFASKKYQKDKAFWSEMYAEHPEYVRLKPNAMTSTSPSANRLYAEVSPVLSKQIKAFCNEHEYSPATVFEAAMLIYLDRINGGGKTPSLGLAVLNRDGAKDKRTLGMFISTIPLTAKPSEDKTLGEFCAEINDLHLQIFRHQKYPYSHILSDIHQHHGDVEKLFDVTVSYQTAQADKSAMAQSHWYGNGYCENTLNFHVDDRDNSGLFHINIDYQVQQFDDQAEVGLLKDRILYIIEQIVSNSAKTIGQTGIISPIEYDLITNIFNQTSQPLPHKSVIDLFGEQAKNAPDQIALVCQGKGVTYSELDKQSNQIANFLIEKDITKGDIVAVSLPRVNISIACILGILKVGAAYLPIDPANPQERIEYILTNSLAKLYITEASLEKCMSHNDSKPIIDVTENDLCYCIYTSGTTGNPKGVAISHHNLLSYIESCKGIYGSDHVIMPYFTAPFVDLTVTSIYLPLLTGGTIYLYPEEVYHSIPQIIENSDLSIIKLTPTHLQLFNQCGNCKELPHISHLILGGENLLAKDCFEFLSRYGAHIKIHNEYGPTETTVGCTDYVYSPNDHALSVPIGHPTANTQLYILDSSMRITPVGIQGELCVAGDGVGMGYLNNPDLTKTFFIPNPFGKGVIYKTGDIAYWSSDGNIVYVGRRDDQVKIHGVRIELGEIAASVLEYPNILQASAVVLNSENNPQVCVYYTASDAVNSNDIRNHIVHRLPRQMLPALFMQIDSMPIASGGKVNKKALPIPDFSKSKPMTEYSAPQTELEKQISNTIEQLLSISRVSIDDDLFDCGLNSLKVIEFIIAMQKEGIFLNAQDVYNHPSVRSLSTFVENNSTQTIVENSNRSNLQDIMKASIQIKSKSENVLLTGATGFLGIHVLKELYRTTDKTIYCLIRDPKKFESAIVYYTDIPYPNDRIICFCGDITEASLGLKNNEYGLLCNDIGDIIHCAATVSLFGAWETSKKINYSGTCNVIALADKASAKLHHISTISVSGDMIVPQEKPHCEFSENDLYIGQSYTENVYVHSKYLAEEAVISAIKNSRINASIYRIGHILWDSQTGLFQKNYQSNDIYMLADAFRTLGKIPNELSERRMPIIPVNECAKIICHELDVKENRIYHLYDDSMTWREFMASFGVTETVSFSAFLKESHGHTLQTLKFAEMFLSAIIASNGRFEVNVINEKTRKYLQKSGYLWQNIDRKYVIVYYSKESGKSPTMQSYSLTTPQQNIYNETKFYSDTALGNIGGTIEFQIDGLTSEIIEKAINLLIDAAEGLRLRITENDGEVYQYATDHQYESIPVIDAIEMADEQIDEHVSALMRAPITYDGKLYRFEILKKADSWLIVAIMHHIVSDAWSMTIIDDAILHTCEALLKGEEPVLNIAPYTDFVAKEREYFSSKKYKKDKAFWSEMYAEHPEYVRLKPNAMTSTSPSANRLYAEVSPVLSKQIKTFCNEHEYSPATVFEAAMLIYLDRINGGGKTPSLGLAVLNRDGAKDKRTLGMFISTIPLTAKPSEDKTLGELCAEINDLHLQIFRHQKYPYSHILSDIHQHHGDVEKLFDVMMSYQNAQIDADINARSKWYTNGNSEVALAFHIDDRDHLGVYKLNLDYQTEQFPDEAEVALLKDRILCIVEQITAKADMTVAEVDILPESEKDLIIHTFNDTAVDYPDHKCVHQLFEEVAANIPDEIAAVFEGASYTYAEINRIANCIAHALRRGGIGRNDIVPIIAHRSHLVLAAQLGVLKAGGAYLPIDPTFPAERITYMLDDASCKAALILDAAAPSNVDFVIDLADEALYAKAPENLDNINEPSDLCYVIYTSGSTGKPKGTMLMHGNVVNFCSNNEHNIITHCITEEQKRIVSTTTIGFDIYVTESLLSLLNGLTVYYANDDESKMQQKLAKLIIENEIEVIQTTPTKMKMYMQDKSDLAWLSRLKVIILGGEVFPESLYEELRHYTDARIWNIYGPTETTVWSSVDEVTSPVITIGNPIANTQILICNEKGDLCPVGIAGELCIAGDGVCRGYLNRDELTVEKFIDNPYVPGKLYKTGDLASYRTDGKLLCYGRIDSQIKIRGLRVELGEIESVMNGFDGIVLSATTVKTHGEHQYLVGYYVSEGDIDEKKLREHILAQLPKYMCPHYFMRLEKIAFTPNGKIDRKNLPNVDFESRENNNEITLPETPLQQEVYEVLCGFIKGTAFGIDEDFFDLGMDSLTAINLTSALSKKYACELSVNDVYKFNTVEKMAEHLSAFASHTKNHDLVLIKKGDDTNIFFIHGGNGSVAEFIELCNKLPFDSTCWGVDLPYSDNNYYPKIIDFPTLAQKYVERIKAVQPNGTYTLCGYCAGGQLALEIAYLLEQAGDTVKIIYNIASLATDLASINASMQNEEKVKNDDIAFVNALFATTPKNNELLAQCGKENIWQYVYEHLEQFDVVADVFRKTLQSIMLPIDAVRAIPSFYENDIKTLLYYANVIRSICYGSGRYTGNRTIHAPIYLFSPDKDDMVSDIPLNAQLWQSHTTEPLTNVVYDGDHFSWYEDGKNAEFLEKFGGMLAHNNDKRVLTVSVLPNYRKNKKCGNILVTGATGYLGCYIIKDLYENTDKKIYCLIRNQEKLNSILSHHTDIRLPDPRIICIKGDITQEHLGLDDSVYQPLIGDISDIIHCAATISLFGSWDVSRNVNYMGTRHVIELARKASAKLHHISTISVSGDSIVKQKNPHMSFSENDLYIGQSYEDNIYAHSKYLAEQEIIENIANDKLDASIYRIGHILWDSSTGKFQDNYYSSDVYMLINAFKEVGKLPVEFASHKMPIIAVNECAKIICHELNADQNRVYHMYDDSITWGELMTALGISAQVPFDEFITEAQKHQTQTVKFAEMFLSAIVASNGQFAVDITNEETKKYLEEHSCLWQGVDSEYVKKMRFND